MKTKRYPIYAVRSVATATKKTVRKKLNADSCLALVRQDFQKLLTLGQVMPKFQWQIP